MFVKRLCSFARSCRSTNQSQAEPCAKNAKSSHSQTFPNLRVRPESDLDVLNVFKCWIQPL